MSSYFSKNKLVIIGLLISLIGLLYGFYRGQASAISEKINYLNNKAEAIRKELAVPLVNLDVSMASDLLSKEMLNKLPIIPSSIEISHLKGETAKNITVEINSKEAIKKISKISSVEPFDVSYTDSTFQKIRINIPELRKDAKVVIILLTAQPSYFDVSFFADRGRLFDLPKEAEERPTKIEIFKKEIGYANSWTFDKDHNNYRSYVVSAAKTTRELQVELIEERIAQLRDESIVKSFIINSVELVIFHPIYLLAALVVLIGIILFVERYNDNKEYEKTLGRIKAGAFQLGDSIASVVSSLGYQPPFIGVYDHSVVDYDLAIGWTKITYCPWSKQIAQEYRLLFLFKHSILIGIEDIYSKETLLSTLSQKRGSVDNPA